MTLFNRIDLKKMDMRAVVVPGEAPESDDEAPGISTVCLNSIPAIQEKDHNSNQELYIKYFSG